MIIKMIKNISVFPLIIFIKLYQLLISPILKNNCRFLPTCSEYAIDSLKEYGLIQGGFLSIKRILHCHPYGDHGYDPVPKKIRKEF